MSKLTNNKRPEWASFLEQEQYAAFMVCVEAYFNNKNIQYTLNDGLIELEENELGFESLGLYNLAQMCHREEIQDYASTVSYHFESIIKINLFEKEFEKIEFNLEAVKEYLSIRIYALDYIEQMGLEHSIFVELAEDLVATIVYDFPHSVSNVSPDMMDKWETNKEYLFQLALENANKNYPAQYAYQKTENLNFYYAHGDHFFVPNIILELENKKELQGSKGTLISIPHRHATLLYPIEDIDLLKAVNFFIPITVKMFDQGPGSISSNLYLYKDGVFTTLPIKIGADQQLQFFPPPVFVSLLETLAT